MLSASESENRIIAEAEEAEKLKSLIGRMSALHDVIVVDCPGADNHLSRLGHTYANTLITPLNDSFVDLGNGFFGSQTVLCARYRHWQ